MRASEFTVVRSRHPVLRRETGSYREVVVDRDLYFIPEHGCYVVRWVADVTKQGFIEHWQDLVSRPEFEPKLAALHDLRGVEIRRGRQATIELGEIYRRDVEPQVGFGRAAIVVASAEDFVRMQRLTGVLELEGTLISYSEQEAKEWVGLPGDFVLPGSEPGR